MNTPHVNSIFLLRIKPFVRSTKDNVVSLFVQNECMLNAKLVFCARPLKVLEQCNVTTLSSSSVEKFEFEIRCTRPKSKYFTLLHASRQQSQLCITRYTGEPVTRGVQWGKECQADRMSSR
jgi:hypothetical protein